MSALLANLGARPMVPARRAPADLQEAMGSAARFREQIGRGLAVSEPASAPRAALRDAIAAACFDPHLAGHRGSRTTDEWRADAGMAVLRDLGVIPGEGGR